MIINTSHISSNAVAVTDVNAVASILNSYHTGTGWAIDYRGRLLLASRNAELYAAPLKNLPSKPKGGDSNREKWPPPQLLYARGEYDFCAMLAALTPYLSAPLFVDFVYAAVGECLGGVLFYVLPGGRVEQIELGYSDAAEHNSITPAIAKRLSA